MASPARSSSSRSPPRRRASQGSDDEGIFVSPKSFCATPDESLALFECEATLEAALIHLDAAAAANVFVLMDKTPLNFSKDTNQWLDCVQFIDVNSNPDIEIVAEKLLSSFQSISNALVTLQEFLLNQDYESHSVHHLLQSSLLRRIEFGLETTDLWSSRLLDCLGTPVMTNTLGLSSLPRLGGKEATAHNDCHADPSNLSTSPLRSVSSRNDSVEFDSIHKLRQQFQEEHPILHIPTKSRVIEVEKKSPIIVKATEDLARPQGVQEIETTVTNVPLLTGTTIVSKEEAKDVVDEKKFTSVSRANREVEDSRAAMGVAARSSPSSKTDPGRVRSQPLHVVQQDVSAVVDSKERDKLFFDSENERLFKSQKMIANLKQQQAEDEARSQAEVVAAARVLESSTYNNRESSTYNNRELSTYNNMESSTDNNRESSTYNNMESSTDNNRESSTYNNMELSTDNNRELQVDDEEHLPISSNIITPHRSQPLTNSHQIPINTRMRLRIKQLNHFYSKLSRPAYSPSDDTSPTDASAAPTSDGDRSVKVIAPLCPAKVQSLSRQLHRCQQRSVLVRNGVIKDLSDRELQTMDKYYRRRYSAHRRNRRVVVSPLLIETQQKLQLSLSTRHSVDELVRVGIIKPATPALLIKLAKHWRKNTLNPADMSTRYSALLASIDRKHGIKASDAQRPWTSDDSTSSIRDRASSLQEQLGNVFRTSTDAAKICAAPGGLLPSYGALVSDTCDTPSANTVDSIDAAAAANDSDDDTEALLAFLVGLEAEDISCHELEVQIAEIRQVLQDRGVKLPPRVTKEQRAAGAARLARREAALRQQEEERRRLDAEREEKLLLKKLSEWIEVTWAPPDEDEYREFCEERKRIEDLERHRQLVNACCRKLNRIRDIQEEIDLDVKVERLADRARRVSSRYYFGKMRFEANCGTFYELWDNFYTQVVADGTERGVLIVEEQLRQMELDKEEFDRLLSGVLEDIAREKQEQTKNSPDLTKESGGISGSDSEWEPSDTERHPSEPSPPSKSSNASTTMAAAKPDVINLFGQFLHEWELSEPTETALEITKKTEEHCSTEPAVSPSDDSTGSRLHLVRRRIDKMAKAGLASLATQGPVPTPEMRRAHRDRMRRKTEELERSIETGSEHCKELIRKGRVNPIDWYSFDEAPKPSIETRVQQMKGRHYNRGVDEVEDSMPLPDLFVLSPRWDSVSEAILCGIVRKKEQLRIVEKKAKTELGRSRREALILRRAARQRERDAKDLEARMNLLNKNRPPPRPATTSATLNRGM